MSALKRRVRQTLTIARRDFTATVFTPIFLLFLFAPAFMASFGAIGGIGAANVSATAAKARVMVAIARPGEANALHRADSALRPLFAGDQRPATLDIRASRGALPMQVDAALRARDAEVIAVMAGPLEHPHIVHRPGETREARYLAALADRALRDLRAPGIAARPVMIVAGAPPPSTGDRNATAFAAVFGVFFLTLFLSGQVIGTMAEERNNKVIEVLAAAVPLESVFLGKLVGMFGVAVLFVAFWAAVLSQASHFLPDADLHPAVGMGWFVALFAAYFAMAYLLLGSVFLGVGAQASTMREIQLLSLPVTIVQVAMFGLSSAAASHPGTTLALVAEAFPLSSPFAMAGRAAALPELWPHAVALAWQALWVAVFITVGARLFRRGVLQSGSPAGAWRRLFGRAAKADRRAAIDTPVS